MKKKKKRYAMRRLSTEGLQVVVGGDSSKGGTTKGGAAHGCPGGIEYCECICACKLPSPILPVLPR